MEDRPEGEERKAVPRDRLVVAVILVAISWLVPVGAVIFVALLWALIFGF